MLKPRTPAGHRAISALWLLSGLLLLCGGGLLALGSNLWAPVTAAAPAVFAGAFAAYVVRLRRHRRTIALAERLVDDGDLESARTLLSPLLAAFPDAPEVERVSGLLLYVSGDPLSAASLLERALPRVGPDPAVVTTLVASYAALNKGGDARRAARVLGEHVDVRLALAWSELVALGGDRAAGARLVAELVHGPEVRLSVGRRAMTGALVATAEAQAGRFERAGTMLRDVETEMVNLVPADHAFLAYLCGVAHRACQDPERARGSFDKALEVAPESIGGALARRERSHLTSST